MRVGDVLPSIPTPQAGWATVKVRPCILVGDLGEGNWLILPLSTKPTGPDGRPNDKIADPERCGVRGAGWLWDQCERVRFSELDDENVFGRVDPETAAIVLRRHCDGVPAHVMRRFYVETIEEAGS